MIWNLAPEDIKVHLGEVHVWRADLHKMVEHRSLLEATLSIDEIKLSRKFNLYSDKLWFILRRGLLRTIMGSYTGKRPGDLHFTSGSSGKPHLTAPHEGLEITFSVSHSFGMAVFAFTKRDTLGVDVEFISREVDINNLALRYFSPDESRYLQHLPVKARREVFFQIWTLKEAYIKGLGSGLSYPLDRFAISVKDNNVPHLAYDEESPSEYGEWKFSLFTPADGYCGAVAVRSHSSLIYFWDAQGLM
jgi:4'-phosphopantetheinyl transferase